MNNTILNSVEEMFRWKIPQKVLNEYDLESIKITTVEKFNEKYTSTNNKKSLNWEETDVLYSFIFIYYLGLLVTNEKRFEELFEEEKAEQMNNRLCRYSSMFLFKCSRDPAFNSLNENELLVRFIKLYFSIGNVIPIWPGGNEARGKKGLFDIPELFFNTYPKWSEELIRQNPNAHMDLVIKNENFLVVKNQSDNENELKEYKNSFENLDKFKLYLTEKPDFYFDYLLRRNLIIEKREIELMKELKNGY